MSNNTYTPEQIQDLVLRLVDAVVVEAPETAQTADLVKQKIRQLGPPTTPIDSEAMQALEALLNS